MLKRLEYIIYAGLIAVAVLYGQRYGAENETYPDVPRPPPPQAEDLPPAAKGVLEQVALSPMPRRPQGQFYSGTAFAINGTGQWLTARHVTEGCSSIQLGSQDNNRRIPATSVIHHMRTDLALITTNGSGGPAQELTQRPPGNKEAGYHVGYPQGIPAALRSRYLGATTVDLADKGAFATRQIRTLGHIWAETERRPSFSGSLGGISGGPTYAASGAVIGVTIAEQPRRGRVVTVPPDLIHDLLARAAVRGWRDMAAEDALSFREEDFDRYGERLRQSASVARVYCLRSSPGRRPPW